MNTIGKRLREERERLGLSQVAFGEVGGVQKRAQINYEADERSPSAEYLSAIAVIGVDVVFILTGSRSDVGSTALGPDEVALLGYFRQASADGRAAITAAAAAMAGAKVVAKPSKTQTFNAPVGQTVQTISGGTFSFDLGEKKK